MMNSERWDAARKHVGEWVKSTNRDDFVPLTVESETRMTHLVYGAIRDAVWGNGSGMNAVRAFVLAEGVRDPMPEGLALDDLAVLATGDGYLRAYLNYLLSYPLGIPTIKKIGVSALLPVDLRSIIDDHPHAIAITSVETFCEVFDGSDIGGVIDDHGQFEITTPILRGAIQRHRDRMTV